MLLFVNSSHGVRYESQSGDLVWWTSSRGGALLGTGRVHPSQILRIEIDNTGEDTAVRLIGLDDRPIHGFSDKNLPGPYKPWAEKLTRRWPAIELRELK